MKSSSLLGEILNRPALWLPIVSLLFAAVFCYPMFCDLVYFGPGVRGWITAGPHLDHLLRLPANGDWDMFTDLRWVAYNTVWTFHQLPLWNPYKCGGMTAIGNPESSFLAPSFLVDLVFGPVTGLYLQIWLHLALGFAGAVVMARAMKMSALAGLIVAATFLSGSWLYLQLSMGNLNLAFAVAYWPWAVAAYYSAIEHKSLRPAALGAVPLALTYLEGNYAFVYVLIMLVALGSIESAIRRSLRPAFTVLVVVILGVALAAPKLVPAFEALRIHPRTQGDVAFDGLEFLPTFLFSRDQDLYRTGPWPMMYAAYGASISILFAVLAVVGLSTFRSRIIMWLLPAAAFLAFARGDSGPASAIELIRHISFAQNLAFPSRFIFGFVLCAAVFAGEGAQFVTDRWHRIGERVVLTVLIAGLSDAWMVGPPNLRYIFHNPIEPVSPSPEFRQLWSEDTQAMTELNQANYGALFCWGYGTGVPTKVRGSNQTDYRGEYYMLGPGEVTQTSWSPNQLSYTVDLPQPQTMVVNQNYYPGWYVSEGKGEVSSGAGLIAVKLPAGRQRIAIRYRPMFFLESIVTSLMALSVIVVMCLRKPRWSAE